MQGTVWGSLLCTASMDKLGQFSYNNSELMYKYKGVVQTPSLGMVDDILSIQKCSRDILKINDFVNAFIEGKELKVSHKKCHRIHLNKKKIKRDSNCPELTVHNDKMDNTKQEKYLGDQKEITSLYINLFKIRRKMQENQNSNTDVMLRTSNNLHDCIVYFSSGN